MLADIKALLADPAFRDCNPPPVLDYAMFFGGNSDEESLAPNQWGYGRPSMAELYARFAQIAQRPDVERVLVGLHGDWDEPVFADDFPPAENVHIFTTASAAEAEKWIDGMQADGVIEGWPYGKPCNAPEPSAGYAVLSVCWD